MSDDIEVTDVAALTPHNEGLYEAGKALMVSSIDVGRDFCKSMIGIAAGAIPITLHSLAWFSAKTSGPVLLRAPS